MINIQNIGDNKCFNWCLFRYLNPAGHHASRTTKADRTFSKVLILKISKVKKKNSIGTSVFGFENKEKPQIYVLKERCKDKHVAFLLIGEKGKSHYVLIEDFNTFMYDHTLHHGRNHFCCYCLQDLSTEEILKHHIKDCLKINNKQLQCLKKAIILNEKIMREKQAYHL